MVAKEVDEFEDITFGVDLNEPIYLSRTPAFAAL